MSLEQLNGKDFRFYRYDPEDGSDPVDLLSVTSIRTLCGEPYLLVRWKLANMADTVLGTMKRTTIGPRGGVRETRQVWEFPGEFARRYTETGGAQSKIDELRKWLTEKSDEPRNIAAARGKMVHRAIERNVAWDRIDRNYLESAFAELSGRDQRELARGINDEDINFVQNSMRHYWQMRAERPIVILAREVRVVNLTVGYAGTFDALLWILPDTLPRDDAPKGHTVTVEDIARLGGRLVLVDWKTATDIHTDYVVQAHAYMSAEFAVVEGKRDRRVTDLLNAATEGGVVHIRPNGCRMHLFRYNEEVARAFLGSAIFARLLARYPEPAALWSETFVTGEPEEEPE